MANKDCGYCKTCSNCQMHHRKIDTLEATLAQMREYIASVHSGEYTPQNLLHLLRQGSTRILDETSDIAAWDKARLLRAEAKGLDDAVVNANDIRLIYQQKARSKFERYPTQCIHIAEILFGLREGHESDAATLRREADGLEGK